MADRARLRRQALQAAASVALAVSAGCSGSHAPAPAAPASSPSAATPPAPPSTAPADPPGVGPEEARIRALRAPYQEVCGPVGDIQACCDGLREACTGAFAEGSMEWGQCVFGPGTEGSHGCTPWGPPVPPAMA